MAQYISNPKIPSRQNVNKSNTCNVHVMRLERYFILTVAIALLGTALAKVISAEGTSGILDRPDPILLFKTRQVLWIAAIIESIVVCMLSLKFLPKFKLLLITWLGSMFICYRVMFVLEGGSNRCPCLGNIVDRLPITPATADGLLACLIIYMVAGGLGLLIGHLFVVRTARDNKSLAHFAAV